MRKVLLLLLAALCPVFLNPVFARAVPVEPSIELVKVDTNAGKFTTVLSTTAAYKTQYSPVQPTDDIQARAAYRAPSRAGNRPDTRDLLNTATSYLGKPYAYGAAGPDAFDCSGFTLYVFKKVGIDLPHLASDQANYGEKVGRNDLEPGDLVFFGYHGSSTIEHVGIYVGNDNFIHASSKKGVVITPLSADYYQRNYKGAVRILPD